MLATGMKISMAKLEELVLPKPKRGHMSEKKLRFEIGKFYRTRGGEKVLLVDIFKFSMLIYSYEAQKIIRLTKTGNFCDKRDDFWDIMSVWTKKPKEPDYMEILDNGIAEL